MRPGGVILPGIMTGLLLLFSMPDLTRPWLMEFPLQFRDLVWPPLLASKPEHCLLLLLLFSLLEMPEDFRLLSESKSRLRSSNVFPAKQKG